MEARLTRMKRFFTIAALAGIGVFGVYWLNRGADFLLRISVAGQVLRIERSGVIVKQYPVSTSKYGVGNQEGSLRTPLGCHVISQKIGAGAAPLTIFRDRVNTGKFATVNMKVPFSGDDLITTRVLRLGGLEPGRNQGGSVDSYRRLIYIHGSPDEGLIGRPASHGCVRMKNTDVMDLFSRVWIGTIVCIDP